MKPGATHANPQRLYKRAKELRHQATLAEKILWHALQIQRRAMKLKFRRQQAISPYIVDFACFHPRMVVEIDGLSHDNPDVMNADTVRDDYLQRKGYAVLRFPDGDVMDNIEGVVTVIVDVAHKLQAMVLAEPTPPPSPPAGGGE